MCGENQRDGEQGQTESRGGSPGTSTKLGESGGRAWELRDSKFELDESNDYRVKDLEALFSGLEAHMISSILVDSVVTYKPHGLEEHSVLESL